MSISIEISQQTEEAKELDKLYYAIERPENVTLSHRELAAKFGVDVEKIRRAKHDRWGKGRVLIPLDKIVRDPAAQPRVEERPETIEDYTSAMKAGAKFPPVKVFVDEEGRVWLADGFQRHTAAGKAGLGEIFADVHWGTREDAILYSLSANATHGDRRTNADKRRAVMTCLTHKKWRKWSDREIGRRCAVDPTFVGRVRKGTTVDGLQSTVRIGADGRTIDTANIGHKPRDGELTVDERRTLLQECEAVIQAGMDNARELCKSAEDMRRLLGPERFEARAKARFGDGWSAAWDMARIMIGADVEAEAG